MSVGLPDTNIRRAEGSSQLYTAEQFLSTHAHEQRACSHKKRYGTRSAADANCRPAWVEVFMLVIQLVVLGCACSRRHLLLGHQWPSCEQATQEALGLSNLRG